MRGWNTDADSNFQLPLICAYVCLLVCLFTVFRKSAVDTALPRMEPTPPEGRQLRSSLCAGNRPHPEGRQGNLAYQHMKTAGLQVDAVAAATAHKRASGHMQLSYGRK